jgi:transcriptional regulator with XRE-family HTH domain
MDYRLLKRADDVVPRRKYSGATRKARARVRSAASYSSLVASKRTDLPFADEVPRLLEERGWSMRRLAAESGVERAYLWKVIRRRGYKSPSVRMAESVAVALGLPRDYFPEYREGVVIESVKHSPRVRDDFFDSLTRRSSRSV